MAPQVVGVLVASSDWGQEYRDALKTDGIGDDDGFMIPTGSIDQLEPLAWSNLDQVSIRFSHEVAVGQGDLRLFGVNVDEYEFRDDDPTDTVPTGQDGFRYDNATQTATWTLTQCPRY